MTWVRNRHVDFGHLPAPGARAARLVAPGTLTDRLAPLEALERNDSDKLPGGIFSRAFVVRTPARWDWTPDVGRRQLV